MRAALGKDRRYLGFAVVDGCTLDDGEIVNGCGNRPFSIAERVEALADIDPAQVREYDAEYHAAIEADDAKGDPVRPAPVKHLSKSGNLVKTPQRVAK